MLRALLWPFLTAARRGEKDRRANAPSATATVAMRAYGGGNGNNERSVSPFIATLVHSSEEQVDDLEASQWTRCSKLNAEAAHIADQVRKHADEIGRDAKRYRDRYGDQPFPERPIGKVSKGAILAALALGEIGFNLNSFNAFGFTMPDGLRALATGGWQIFAVAGMASGLLPFIGHRIGYQMRRFNKLAMTLNEKVTLGLSIGGVIWLISFLTFLRAEGHEIAGGGLASILIHAAFNVAMTVAGYLVAFWYHFDDELEDLALRQDRNTKRLAKLQRAFNKVALKHDPLLNRLRAKASKIRDNAATRAAEYVDYNLRGDVGELPHLTRNIVLDLFRPREFDGASPLAVTPSAMTRVLEDAGILPAERTDYPGQPRPAALNGAIHPNHEAPNIIERDTGPEEIPNAH